MALTLLLFIVPFAQVTQRLPATVTCVQQTAVQVPGLRVLEVHASCLHFSTSSTPHALLHPSRQTVESSRTWGG